MAITRRHFIASAAALAAGFSATAALAQAAAVGAIRVDMGPALAKGGGHQVRVMGPMLDAALRQAFAGRLTPGGSLLVVSIHSVWLNDSGLGNANERHGGSGSANDYMETRAVLVGGRGQELGRYEILSPVPNASRGVWTAEEERRRLGALAAHNAGWMRRYVAGY